jgi:hypothetical protein
MTYFKYWFLFLCVYLISVFFCDYYKITHLIFEEDLSYISTAIFVVFNIMTGLIGYMLYRTCKYKTIYKTDFLYFSSKHFTTFGMIGTILGLIFMFQNSFAEFTPGDVAVGTAVIKEIASGASTAFYTTLLGLIAYFLSQFQLRLLEYAEEKV